MKKALCISLVVLLAAIALAGCSFINSGEKETEITLFFADKTLIETGQLGEYGYVVPVKRVIPAAEDILNATIEELVKGPLPEDDNVDSVMPESTVVLGVEISDGVAVINFNRDIIEKSPGGILGGSIMVQSLVYTATQFSDVDKVMVLVEGEPWSDGHSIWEHPLGREDF